MRSKGTTAILGFFFGSTGAARFYIGQTKKGWLFLSIFWGLFPALVWSIQHFFLLEYWRGALVLWLISIICIHLAEGIRFARMDGSAFSAQIQSYGGVLALTFLSILIAGMLGYGATVLLKEKNINIIEADAEYTLSSKDFSSAFRSDENAFNTKYLKKVVQVNGMVIETGEDFEKGSYFALEGIDVFGIKCYFISENVGDTKGVDKYDVVTMKGVCEGNMLENCKVIQVVKGTPPAHTTNSTDTTLTTN